MLRPIVSLAVLALLLAGCQTAPDWAPSIADDADATVRFVDNQSYLTERAQARLSEIAEAQAHTDSRLYLIGHAYDRPGSQAYNAGLSKRRAEAAKAFLAEAGIDPARMTTDAHGDRDPRIAAVNIRERKANNVVEVFVVAAHG